MYISEAKNTILIANPCTGNSAVIKGLGLAMARKVSATWQKPSDARKLVSSQRWLECKKMILVRDPLERFNSGVIRMLNEMLLNDDSVWELGDPIFPKLHEALKSLPLDKMAEAVLMFIEEHGFNEVPEYFHPQSLWLTAKFDIVLCTQHIAEFFNVKGEVSVMRSNARASSRNTPSDRLLTGSTANMERIRKVFAEDYTILEKLRVWAPDPRRIRLALAGYCSLCEAQRNSETKTKPVLDLSQYDEQSTDEPETELAPLEVGESDLPQVVKAKSGKTRRNQKA